MYFCIYTPQIDFPPLLLLSDGTFLTGVHFLTAEAKISLPAGDPSANQAPFPETFRWLDQYFQGRDPCQKPPMRPLHHSAFQKEVSDLLCAIPYGQAVSYGSMAKQIALMHHIPRMSAQAIGGAVHANPINILIPCHRVVGKNGDLTGFGGGMAVKIALLRLEGHIIQSDSEVNHVRIVNFIEKPCFSPKALDEN